ncbi:MAG: hypothetical protein JO313_11485 [Verrucomicrobia bacterium]|nr:hypothetical protein [Verrucomicrobiota bacterium]MBV9129985.1 hypothetical protein [Verrucomicrobiota bacterium]
MNPDPHAEDPARKETQEFDPALVDEQGIHPETAPDSLTQDQSSEEGEERPGRSDNWQTFQTP